jgi:hypothetical protein
MNRTALRVGVALVLGVVAVALALQIARLIALGVALSVVAGLLYLGYRLLVRAGSEPEPDAEYGVEERDDGTDPDVEAELDSLRRERDADRELEYE